ncbi:phosphatidylinositol-specific phospholipase C/glycerophosphodiester phosphodiesterase family protein [Niabella drilacis]|uniref:Altered inheritance of mitochondria protein 6 n=1 Tax=Niabella drilacis (strain DSM 25811 / CCM 8410 / CCUG 62505 / LMG 26954 / E90) TaxID=1285928 RepID=A0A1G6IDQ6_NIADE|nr:phosphatidylinositol-specific phospholipase C/glycerophosphodiester phosphodiesterase family protein [Niabella drilacis]SDC04135.1 Glycerophosphoryl diester phosphodiesterase [Niabella drilacis]
MRINMFLFLLLIALGGNAQPRSYTVGNAHSHNDYEQDRPFWAAYEAGFGSVEADVFLVNGNLPVAHNAGDIRPGNDLKSRYLEPLKACIQKNKGSVYADRHKRLNLLIDCKTEGRATLAAIIDVLKQYPEITGNKRIRVVITGNRPHKDSLFMYPAFIWFDGELTNKYTGRNLARVALFSANFRNYAQWNGAGTPDAASEAALQQQIRYAHKLGKPIRFWGAPDTENAWKTFQRLGVDYINTDKIAELSQYLEANRF